MHEANGDNPDLNPMVLRESSDRDIRVVAEMLEVLTTY